MTTDILIIVVSSILLVAWFRSTCLLLLGNKPQRDLFARGVDLQQCKYCSLKAEIGDEIDPEVERILHRDYAALMRLLSSADLRALEVRMLAVDFALMSACLRIARWTAPGLQGRFAREMACVLDVFADRVARSKASEFHLRRY